MKNLYVTIALLILSNTLLFAQYSLPIYEPFQLQLGALAGQNTWNGDATGAQVVSGNLSYTGLPASKGNFVAFGQNTGNTQALGFTDQTGTVYASFLIQVSSLPLTLSNSKYNICFADGFTGGKFAGCMYVVPTSATTFGLGFNGTNSQPSLSNTTPDFQLNTTIMVVMAYTPGLALNDGLGTVSAWVNPAAASFGATAPTPTFANISGGNIPNVKSVLIRSGAQTNPMIIDELRVGTSWADVTTYNVVLPVKLANFSAKRKLNTTELSWSAATEIDFDRYVVLYSKNGVEFNEIGSVKGKGNNSNYTFNYAHDGDAYFKLKAVDLNGQFEFSKVIYAKGNAASIKAGPNPFSDELSITGMLDGVNTITLHNLNGTRIRTQTVNGSNIRLSLAEIPSGEYVLKVSNGNVAIYSGVYIKY